MYDLKKMGHSISGDDANMRDVSEIINELKNLNDNFNTHSMSEHRLLLKGQKDMLEAIIEYLEFT